MANNACYSSSDIRRSNAFPWGRTLEHRQLSLHPISLCHQNVYGRFSEWPRTACLKPHASPFVTGKPRFRATLFEFLFARTGRKQNNIFFTRWSRHLNFLSYRQCGILMHTRGFKPFNHVCEPDVTSKAVPCRIELELTVLRTARRLSEKG